MRELAPGAVVAGYRIESLLGRGGMGVVYKAVQPGLNRVVALKVIAPELLDDQDVRARFLTEARAAASVDHPNVIPVHDAGEDDGVAFIAMRFVAGDDLRSLVRRGGPLDPVEAAEIVAQAGAALDAIHRAGFVHRDVKPANLLVDPDRHVYLTDFGLAKAVLTRTGGTRTGHWVGTLDYIAPEQIRGGRIDARVDVYALGGVLHYALTRRVPFERHGDEAKLWAQLSAPPPVPSEVRAGLPEAFDRVVARAMAKRADARYPSAGDLGRAARAAALGRAPSEPERMVARGAAALGVAPSQPGLVGEVPTRTAGPRGAPPPGARAGGSGEGPVRGGGAGGSGEGPVRGGGAGGSGEGPRAGRPGRGHPREVAAGGRRRRRALVTAGGGLAVGAVVAVLLLRPDEPPSRAALEGGSPTATATATAAASAAPSPTEAPAALPRVVQTIDKVGDRPTGIAIAGGDLWVTSPRSPFLTRIVAKTGTERRRHPKIGPDATAIVAYRETVWIALGEGREVVGLDARTGAIRRRISIPAGPRRLAVDRNGVWVGTNSPHGQPGLLLRYDARTGDLRQTITVKEGVGPMVAVRDTLWVVKRDTAKLTRLDRGAAALVDVATLPGLVGSVRYGQGNLWLVLQEQDTIARVGIDGRGPFTASAGHAPTQALVAGGRVFVACRNDQAVLVLDPKTLRPVMPPIPVGLNPVAMAADDRSLWVTSVGENSVTRIDYR